MINLESRNFFKNEASNMKENGKKPWEKIYFEYENRNKHRRKKWTNRTTNK
jgi:hypothetical protein